MKNKKKIFLALSVITNVGMLTPLVISCNNNGNDHSNAKYKIGDKYFDNKKDIIEYLIQSAEVQNKTKYKNAYLSEEKAFSNYYSLINSTTKNINKIKANTYLSSEKLQKMLNFDGQIDENFLSNFRFDSTDKNIKVYKGLNNIAYKNEQEAKESYFNINPVFEFNNKYYKTPEELSINYLKAAKKIETDPKLKNDLEKIKELQSLFPIDSSQKRIIVFNNGKIEQLYNNDSSQEAIEHLKKVIRNNLNVFYEIDGQFYSLEDLVNRPDILLKDLSMFNVLKVQSNSGKKSYLVDVNKEEGYSLVGNYVHKTNSNEIEDFLNLDKWIKSNDYPNSLEYKINSKNLIINSITDFIFSMDNDFEISKYLEAKKKNQITSLDHTMLEFNLNLNSKNYEEAKNILEERFLKNLNIFNIVKLNNEFKFFEKEMNKVIIDQTNNTTLMDKFNEIIQIVEKGKRGSLLSQLPLIYISGISYLGNTKASTKTISTFIKYIQSVNKFFNDSLNSLIGDDLYITNTGEKIDLTKQFKFDGISLDTNMDINSYSGFLSNNSVVYNSIKNLYYAFQNIVNYLGAYEFDEKFYDADVISNQKYREKLEKTFNRFKILNLYNGTNSSLFVNKNKKIELESSNFNSNDDINYRNFVGFAAKMANAKIESFHEIKSKSINKFISDLKLELTTFYDTDKSTIVAFLNSYFEKIEKYVKNSIKDKNIVDRIEKDKKYFLINPELYVLNVWKKFEAHLKFIIENDEFGLFSDSFNIFKTQNKTEKDFNDPYKFSFLFYYVNTFNKYNNYYDNINSIYQNFQIMNNFIDRIAGFASGKFSIILNVMKNIFDLIAEINGKISSHSYVFYDSQEPNNHFIWDGGRTRSRFWGSSVEDVNTISEAKLLKPVQMDLANIKTYYLYNKMQFEEQNLDALKRAIINNILKDNNKFKKYYSLNNLKDFIKFESSSKIASKEEATEYWSQTIYLKFVSSLYSINNINVSSKNYSDYYKAVNDELLKLKPIYIVQIPKKSNLIYPKDQEEKSNSFEMYETFDEIINQLNTNPDKVKEKVIYFDSKIQNNNKYLDYSEIEALLKKMFLNNIEVKSKYSSEMNFLITKNFEELQSSKDIYLYSIVDKEGNKEYYLNFSDALKHLSSPSHLNIRIQKQIESIKTVFILNNQSFKNKNELIEFLEKEVEKYEIKNN
ncbi:hypothetical protein [Mycoplasmopsis fermentans]|uniref:hypothetical protein n=2 Tax=Mycoplasmopsis fermentans TaxID=2115 RepID=UPI000F0224B1|nr:hypothetical protein [Mycoplasmopsis fermentans]RMX35635.1 putative lipoprotein [Mycoplasmopsis fermentans MF-I2]